MNTDIYAHAPTQINTVSDLIAFFQGIPEDRWGTHNRESNGNRCALGHLGAACFGSAESRTVYSLLDKCGVEGSQIYLHNDGAVNPSTRWTGHPKARVLAYLHSLLPSDPAPSQERLEAVALSVLAPS